MADHDKSLGDQNTFDGGSKEDLDAKSLGDEATFAGGVGGESKSLGDEVTCSGDSGSDDDLLDDGMEVVDLESRYKTEGVLGKGGMGEVLLATDTRLERKVAIKRILGSAARSKTAVNRFLTEAKSIAALNHPNIVQIYDYGRDNDGPFLIMEYVEGNSLLDKCGEGAIPLEEAVDLVCQLCDGLGKAHAANIIHRDIKPANILITEDGIPKLTDFGLAKDETADTEMTMAGAVLGTLDFMPPEQRRDAALVDARSDLWALAATFYQMVTGKSPKIIKFNDVPKSLHDVLGKALEDSKDDRYQTARDLRDALKASQSASADDMELEEGDCPHCGTRNPINRKFCRECAESLEVPCLSCSAKIPMWEKVCDSCGTKQSELLKKRRYRMASDQAEAESLLKSHLFERAGELAIALRDEPDLRLQHLKTWAEGFLPQIEQGREQEHSRIGGLLDEALAHQQAHDYAAGLRALEQVPDVLTDISLPGQKLSVGKLRKELQSTLDETTRLELLIRRRVKKGKNQSLLNGLLPEVEKLQRIQPPREDLKKLHSHLTKRNRKLQATRDEAIPEAKKLFESQDYGGCLKQIARIDASLMNAEITALKEWAEGNRNRLKELKNTIHSRVKANQLRGLLQVVEEHLSLQSDSKEMQKLRGQLVEREAKNAAAVETVVQDAAALWQQCKFAAAVSALQRIPKEQATEMSSALLANCQHLDSLQSGAMKALQMAMQTEDYQQGLSLASGYRTAVINASLMNPSNLIDRLLGEGLTDGAFAQAYAACQNALQSQQEEEESAKRQRALMNKMGIGVAVLIGIVLLVVVGFWIRSSMQASALGSAIGGQRWDEALAIDADNVEALIGRAKSRLAGDSPNVEGAFADLTRAGEIDSGTTGLKEAQRLAYSIRAREQAEAGNIAEAESDLRQAVSQGADANDQVEAKEAQAKEALSEAFVKRGKESAGTGNVAAAEADYRKAQSYGSGSSLNALKNALAEAFVKRGQDGARTGNLAAAEADYKLAQSYNAVISLNALKEALADAWLKRAEAAAAANQGSEVSTALTKALSYAPGLKITGPVLAMYAREAIATFEKDLSQESEEAALAAIDKLEETDGSASELPALRQRLSVSYLQRGGNLADRDPESAAQDLATAESLGADPSSSAELKGKIVSALVSQAEGHLTAGDYAQGFAGYGLLSQLDPAVAAKLKVKIVSALVSQAEGHLTAGDYAQGFAGYGLLSKLDPAVAAKLKVKIVSALVSQAEGHLKAGDYAQGFVNYSMLNQLDPTAAANLNKLIKWKSLTGDDISNLPPEVISKLPTEVISKLPPIENSIGMKFKLIPFENLRGERLKPFFLGVTEVTQEQYERVMGTNPSEFKGAQNPVETVSWDDAVEFCRKLSVKEGKTYRLPTTAEWDYACKAGKTWNDVFGGDPSPLGDYAWYESNSEEMTHPVRRKKPNAWGLYDIHGNVWEWNQDESGSFRGVPTHRYRGGSWNFPARYCQPEDQSYVELQSDGTYSKSKSLRAYLEEDGDSNLGFRVARDP